MRVTVAHPIWMSGPIKSSHAGITLRRIFCWLHSLVFTTTAYIRHVRVSGTCALRVRCSDSHNLGSPSREPDRFVIDSYRRDHKFYVFHPIEGLHVLRVTNAPVNATELMVLGTVSSGDGGLWRRGLLVRVEP